MKKALVLAGGGARGSYQVGVLKYLWQKKWIPDIICGSSVGAMNAVAVASGMTPEKLAKIWLSYHHRDIFQIKFIKFITSLFPYRKLHAVVSPKPLKTLIEQNIDFQLLRKSSMETIITAVNVRTSQVAYFSKNTITLKHLVASAAMPLMCPSQTIDGEIYWDGGVIDNVPIIPAIHSGADEMIVVLLSPVSAFKQLLPGSVHDTMELVFEQSLMASFNTILADRFWPKSLKNGMYASPLPNYIETIGRQTRIAMVAPVRMLGFRSLSNFSKKQARTLIREGYEDARVQLDRFV